MNQPTKLTLISRKSPLAKQQAHLVMQAIAKVTANTELDLVTTTTIGDRSANLPMPIDKSKYVQDLQTKILAGKADIAVHSLKDMPLDPHPDLQQMTVLERALTNDCLITSKDFQFATLPINAKVGTSSPRRKAQLLHLRPDLEIVPLRGNINSRIEKLQYRQYDAIVLAIAGIERLQLQLPYCQILPIASNIPAPGQGAIAVEFHKDNPKLADLLQSITHSETVLATQCERTFAKYLGFDCNSPIGAHCQVVKNQLQLHCFAATSDNISRVVKDCFIGSTDDYQQLAQISANKVLSQL